MRFLREWFRYVDGRGMNRRGAAASLALLAALLPRLAAADAQDTVSVFASVDRMWDNNLFRGPAGWKDDDTVTSSRIGLRLNKAYSLQRFVLDAAVTKYNFQKNDHLNYTGMNHKAAWLWSVTPRLHGNWSLDYQRAMNNFTDYTGRQKNVRTTKNYRFDAVWEVMGGWQLQGGVSRYEQKNEEIFLQEGDYDANTAEYGVKYVFPSGSSVALLGRSSQGKYANRTVNAINLIDSGFDQQNTELRLTWLASAKSRFDLNLGHLNREHDHFSVRDFSGTVGSLDYTWAATGKIRVNANVRQSLNSYQEGWSQGWQSSYYRSRSYGISPVWQPTAKTSVRAGLRWENRDFRGAICPAWMMGGCPSFGGREDTSRQSSLSVDWMPYSMLTLSASVQKERRNSNRDTYDFDDRTVNFSAQLTF
ncbi:MAG: putative exosortase B-associated extracellular polysaccharide biosynthesis transporter EpsL [Zoogloeaceae bacterium]|jgi:exopolysaccharide biosynthesis operon protein EpsL|nr:putative exosortase B-associated extracellular polysaccharide biosynthesis transporter EpsL [Zoogloeaceae bacterium]